jgi:hypothetical protein
MTPDTEVYAVDTARHPGDRISSVAPECRRTKRHF